MSPLHVNLNPALDSGTLSDADRIVASPDGNHFFTFRPDWKGPVPLPFRAAAATVTLLPAALQQPKVLILGFGMGAMASIMKRVRNGVVIVGVEPDRALHRAALATLEGNIDLHLDDALSFLKRTSETFDLILDDCFVVTKDELDQDQPYRPLELEELPALAAAQLNRDGVYVRNMLDQDDLPLVRQQREVERYFAHREERRFRDWDNVLSVASNAPMLAESVDQLGA